jgi:hypothetical protein
MPDIVKVLYGVHRCMTVIVVGGWLIRGLGIDLDNESIPTIMHQYWRYATTDGAGSVPSHCTPLKLLSYKPTFFMLPMLLRLSPRRLFLFELASLLLHCGRAQ